ncbi:hypothetical protein [Sphaerotilus sp.]|uniref:hypothetical protein n=1 Tax=Sphaerotilus sp. TaxID=2093942 RepID=UPI0034E1CC9F
MTRQTVASLLTNRLAADSVLHVFCDGPRPGQESRVQAVREYVRSITGFARVVLHEQEVNLGLSRAIMDGVSEILKTHERVIVLEDDLKLSAGFLDFMNQALQAYAANPRVMSVSGYSFPIRHAREQVQDAVFGLRASSWGWGIWRDRWQAIDWEVSDYVRFRSNPVRRFQFNRGGSDLSRMLDRQMAGRINSWAIRFCYHQFSHGLVDVFPVRSLVENIGFGDGAEHCRQDVRGWTSEMVEVPPTRFCLPQDVRTDPDVLRQFRSFNSLTARAIRVAKRQWLSLVVWFGRPASAPVAPKSKRSNLLGPLSPW